MGYYQDVTFTRLDALKKFRDEVRSADLKEDTVFQRVMGEARVLLEMSDKEIADALSVSRPTVNRWVNGKNLPYYAMRRPIQTWIGDQVAQRIRRIEASALAAVV